jgi:NAD-dependent SIR2 family protein deacetylase
MMVSAPSPDVIEGDITMYIIPSELVDEFSRGNGSLFVGAGLSIGAGLPSWTTLVKPLADELEGIPEGTSLLKIAQFYENTFGRRRLVERLRVALDSYRIPPTEAHLALAMLPVRRIFTTNFDGLIEEALAAQAIPCTKVVNTEELPLLDASRMQLIKLHGDLEQPRSVVITADDYNGYLDDRPAIAELLKIEL